MKLAFSQVPVSMSTVEEESDVKDDNSIPNVAYVYVNDLRKDRFVSLRHIPDMCCRCLLC